MTFDEAVEHYAYWRVDGPWLIGVERRTFGKAMVVLARVDCILIYLNGW